MFQRFITFPARHLIVIVPVTILLALIIGLRIDTSPMRRLILPVAILMVYPAMIGLQLSELLHLRERGLIAANLILNFLILPAAAWGIGRLVLADQPELRTGLLLISLIPGGNMVVAFTMLFQGNMAASLKLTAINLILGGLLAPPFLSLLAGSLVPVDLGRIARTVLLVVVVPLVMGLITHRILLARYGKRTFTRRIKPCLPGISGWGLIYIVFTSVSGQAAHIFAYPELLVRSLLALALFYLLIFALCLPMGRLWFNRRDGITLLLNILLRNLAIAIALAGTVFSSRTAMQVALAFLFQQQLAIWFNRFENRFHLLGL